MAELAKRFDVIVPEHPGFGASDTPAWLDTVGDLANFYLDFLDALDLRGVHLVGSSLGGWIAADLAVRNASRLASLTLIGAAGILRSTQEAVAMAIANDETSAAPLEIAARVDPGSYRIQVRVAEADERRGHCAAVITHATAARKLFPSAPAPRHLLARCR